MIFSSSFIYGGIALVTLAYSIYEIYTALSLDSLTLLSDGFHNLSDVLALLIGWQCERLSQRSSRTVMSYGWSRAELVGALLNGSSLLSLCVYVTLELFPRVLQPRPIDDASFGLQFVVVASVGLAVNLLGTVVFWCTGTKSFHSHSHAHSHAHAHGSDEQLSHRSDPDDDQHDPHDLDDRHESSACGAHAHHDHHEQSIEIDVPLPVSAASARRRRKSKPRRQWNVNRYAVFLHFLGDALSSLGVLITGVILHYYATAAWAVYADAAASALIVVFLVVTTAPLVKRTAIIMMQMVPDGVDVADVSARLLSAAPCVVAVKALHVWRLDADTIVGTAHVVVGADAFGSLEQQSDVRARLTRIFLDAGVHNTTVELHSDKSTKKPATTSSSSTTLLSPLFESVVI
jgi:solute carrier family 30 (zinc transporter), member 1